MFNLRLTCLFAVVLPHLAMASEQMTPEVFEAYSAGKTLTFALEDGKIYGTEQYFPGRRVLWSTADGACLNGQWYADLDLVCFVYDGDPEPKCWSFYAAKPGLTAIYENEPDSTKLYVVQTTTAEISCPAPWLGS